MKKFIISTAMLAALVSCKKEEVSCKNEEQPKTEKVDTIAVNEEYIKSNGFRQVAKDNYYHMYLELDNPAKDTITVVETWKSSNDGGITFKEYVDTVKFRPYLLQQEAETHRIEFPKGTDLYFWLVPYEAKIISITAKNAYFKVPSVYKK